MASAAVVPEGAGARRTPLPPATRMPARTTRGAPCASPWSRRLMALVRGCLLAVIGLCALAHGSSDATHGPPRAAAPLVTLIAPASVASVAGSEAPHGPHHRHGGDECAADGVLRTTTAVAEQPPPVVGSVPFVGVLATVTRRPPRPCGRRRARTGRTALVRTSRWRI
ncbi:hypothetical protein FNH08_47605 [Streptomyces spongiae]|uniref:Uncharacterized protein n=2 Tax=Streptomyces spongiae TaxID=565072 RepID=A0A5N8XZ32_9ACTN|nr:hypothetical protein [Streptomyces spongiae]